MYHFLLLHQMIKLLVWRGDIFLSSKTADPVKYTSAPFSFTKETWDYIILVKFSFSYESSIIICVVVKRGREADHNKLVKCEFSKLGGLDLSRRGLDRDSRSRRQNQSQRDG